MRPITKRKKLDIIREQGSKFEAVDSADLPKAPRIKKSRVGARKEKLKVPSSKDVGKKDAAALPRPYADDLMPFAHDLAVDLFEGGLIDQTTMREIDDLVLTPVKELGPDEIKSLRVAAGFSQAVLARVLNVTSSSVSQWERGEKNPSGSALKLLSLASDKGMQAIM